MKLGVRTGPSKDQKRFRCDSGDLEPARLVTKTGGRGFRALSCVLGITGSLCTMQQATGRTTNDLSSF